MTSSGGGRVLRPRNPARIALCQTGSGEKCFFFKKNRPFSVRVTATHYANNNLASPPFFSSRLLACFVKDIPARARRILWENGASTRTIFRLFLLFSIPPRREKIMKRTFFCTARSVLLHTHGVVERFVVLFGGGGGGGMRRGKCGKERRHNHSV